MRSLFPLFTLRKLTLYSLLFAGAGCAHRSFPSDSCEMAAIQQKQTLIALQKKLARAEKQQEKIGQEVNQLREAIYQTELTLIRSAVAGCEHRIASYQANLEKENCLENPGHTLFLEERETLHRLIQSGVSPVNLEAQVVLDEILRMITHFSELK